MQKKRQKKRQKTESEIPEGALSGKKKWRKCLERVLVILAFLLCFGTVAYPILSNYLSEKENSQLILDYQKEVEDRSEEEYEAELAACREYNRLLNTKVSEVSLEQWNEVKDKEYGKRLNLDGTGMMGYIEIPSIGVSLPIYHSTSDDVLNAGIGHMEGTSLPVGGTGTHAVLTGHTGMSSQRMLTDLRSVTEGDYFILQILNETLYYQVDQIKTVLPSVTEDLLIDDNEDYLTLITCTPYGINTHRLLVRGTRVEVEECDEEAIVSENEALQMESSSWLTHYISALRVGIAVFLSIMGLSFLASVCRQKKKRRSVLMLFCTLLSVGLLAASLGYITHTFWQYRESEQYYESVRDEYLNDGESVPLTDPEKNPAANESGLSEDFPATDALEAGESVSYTPRNVNFSGMEEASAPDTEVVGWLYSPGTVIDYPIGFSGDNSYFLNHTLDGEERIAGALFLDGGCPTDFSAPHSVIYGHCMRNGSMFGSLSKYRNQDYYEAHSCMYLTLANGEKYQLCIFSVYTANSETERSCWQTGFRQGSSQLTGWLAMAESRSCIQSIYEVPEAGKYVTLSTCAYEYTNAKCLVVGFLVEVPDSVHMKG